jgi:hypothetical protein
MIDIATCLTYTYSLGTSADLYQNVSADAPSANVIDLWSVATNVPSGNTYITLTGHNAPWLIVTIGGTAARGVGTFEFRLVSSTSTTLTGATVVARYSVANTAMTAGATVINQQIPAGRYNRYLGLYFNITTTVCDTVLAYLSDGPEPAPSVVAVNS